MKILLPVLLCLPMVSCFLFKKEEPKYTGTASFERTQGNSPFSSCRSELRNYEFQDSTVSNDFFRVKVDPSWKYKYEFTTSLVHLYRWVDPAHPSIKFTIIVDDEKYTREDGKRYAKITHVDPIVYLLDGDSCDWLSNVGEFIENGLTYYSYENRFQYYCAENQRLYYLFITDSATSRNELDMNCQCMFQKSIESFVTIKP